MTSRPGPTDEGSVLSGSVVRRATTEDIPSSAATIARAFRGEPILRWVFPGPGRESRLRRFFEAYDGRAVGLGWLWVAEPPGVQGPAGIAMWVPPRSGEAYARLEVAVRSDLLPLTGDGAERYDGFWAWVETIRPTEPHWYLDHLAVEPDRQGRGFGLALLRHGLGRASADRVPAFLVTAVQDDVGFYGKRGFGIVRAEDPPGGGPHVWFMRHDP